jgi:hypothetical protein
MLSSIEVFYVGLYRSFVFCCPVIEVLCYVFQYRSFVLCCPVLKFCFMLSSI